MFLELPIEFRQKTGKKQAKKSPDISGAKIEETRFYQLKIPDQQSLVR
jgi:hypothetical protein